MTTRVLCVDEMALAGLWPDGEGVAPAGRPAEQALMDLVRMPYAAAFVARDWPDSLLDGTARTLEIATLVWGRHELLSRRQPGTMAGRRSLDFGGPVHEPTPLDAYAMGHSSATVYGYLRSEAARLLREQLNTGPWSLLELVPHGLEREATAGGGTRLCVLFFAYLDGHGELERLLLNRAPARADARLVAPARLVADRDDYDPWSRRMIDRLFGSPG